MRHPLSLLSLTTLTCVLAALLLVPAPPALPSAGWTWPLDPRPVVVRRFERPQSPWGSGHRGVDLLGAPRQAVRAAGGGVVTFAGLLAGRGVVVVTHGTVRTTYEPVGAQVRVGERLAAGDVLGSLHPSASHCAPRACLHWGALRAGSYVDPLQLLAGGRPRLLPLDELPPTDRTQPRAHIPGPPPTDGFVSPPAATAILAVLAAILQPGILALRFHGPPPAHAGVAAPSAASVHLSPPSERSRSPPGQLRAQPATSLSHPLATAHCHLRKAGNRADWLRSRQPAAAHPAG